MARFGRSFPTPVTRNAYLYASPLTIAFVSDTLLSSGSAAKADLLHRTATDSSVEADSLSLHVFRTASDSLVESDSVKIGVSRHGSDSLAAVDTNIDTTVHEYSAVIYEVAETDWSGVTVGFTASPSIYWTLIADAIVPALGGVVSLGHTNSSTFSADSGANIPALADANSVLVVAINGESHAGSWDVSHVEAVGLSFAKRSDVHVNNILNTTGTQRTQVWWAPVSSAFNGNIALALTAAIQNATVHVFVVNGADLTSPFDAGSATTATGGSSPTLLSTTFSTSTVGAFVFVVGANPNGDVHWGTYEP